MSRLFLLGTPLPVPVMTENIRNISPLMYFTATVRGPNLLEMIER